MLTRRGIIGGIASLLAAPAIVKADSLMKVRGIILPPKFMTVTLEGIDANNIMHCVGPESASPYPPYTWIPKPLKQEIDVPWLGSMEKSMDWYRTEVNKYRKQFSEVRSMYWSYNRKYSDIGVFGLCRKAGLLFDGGTGALVQAGGSGDSPEQRDNRVEQHDGGNQD